MFLNNEFVNKKISLLDFKGFLYSKELVLVLLIKKEGEEYSVFISIDCKADASSKKIREKLTVMLNALTLFSSHLVSDELEFGDFWNQVNIKKETCFIKVSRENFILTLQAEELLKEHPHRHN